MKLLFFFYSLVCFVLLSQSFSFSFAHHLCSPSEAFALLQFKQPFEISDWNSGGCFNIIWQNSVPKTMSWNESRDCCTWDGVTCDMLTGHVVGLDLSCSQLGGNIHPNSSLFQLHHLQALNLAYNNFNFSSIPNDIGRLRNLRHLNLSYSRFYGKIPTEISYLSKLVSLDLSGYRCELDQKTFETLLSNITTLEAVYLSHVNISSPIPVNLSSSLRYVDLQSTKLQGVLIEKFFLLPNLERLNLGGNYLSGELPDSIGTLKSLNHLNLQSCDLSGPIPQSIGNLTQIRILIFGHNNFTGHIPPTISKLKHLKWLDLWSNSLGGEIPDVFSNLQEIVELDLSHNSLNGPFPSSILSLRSLERLYLSSNSLSGPLPSNASMLQKLILLDFSHNSLNGTIPPWVFSLPSLDSLELHHNRFNALSDELKTNPGLKFLDLSHNQLSGPLPRSFANLTNLTELYLSSNNITDDVGIEALATMQRLTYIYLSYNPLSLRTSFNDSKTIFPSLIDLSLSSCELDDFPHFLRNLKMLSSLDLSNNKIHGPIPNWFSSMRWDSLGYLNLSHNSLTGHLELLHYYSLKYLDLKFNFLQGPLSSSICNISSLSILDLSYNYFSDLVPHCFSNMSKLSMLDLRRNNFSGSLPSLCTQSTSYLTTIDLNANQFEGTIPLSWLKCQELKVLDVGNNAINDTYPAWLGTLQELQVLILKSNKFYGPISSCQTKFCFPKLRIFDLSHNEFSGSLPEKVFENLRAMIKLDGADKGKIEYIEWYHLTIEVMIKDSVSLVIKGQDIELERISTILTAIDLSSNHFEGVIPKAIKDLGSLWLLNLSYNNLKGDIPTELGQLNILEVLDLSWNQLTGKIPSELTKMKFLAFLNLSQNHLVGPIPHGPQFNTFENDSYGGNIDLCGLPLTKQCGTSDPSHVPQQLESEEEDESYFTSGFTWESVVIGYSCGLVVGTVVWNLIFKAGKPKWFVEFFDGIIPHKRRRPKKRAQRRRT